MTMTESDVVRHVPVSVSEDNIQNGALLLLRHIRPTWDSDRVHFTLLTDGITNKLLKCSLRTVEDDVVLVRVYGRKTDLLIDRTSEKRNIILLHNENLAPQLYASFENGIAYEFVPGVTLNRDTVQLPDVFLLVAGKMAKLHSVKNSGESNIKPVIWDKLYQFYNLIPDAFTERRKQKKFKKLNVSKEKLMTEIKRMEQELKKVKSPIVFCHNDLLLGNVIYNSDNRSVTFIDYEYAGMNYQAFDIGNHFNEFAGVEDIDYGRYPDKVLQMAWLYEYLRVFRGGDHCVTEQEVNRLYVQANKFSLLSHILWGLWALIQAEHSSIDFDFFKFASDHLSRYFAKRDEYLALDDTKCNKCKSKGCILQNA